MCFDAAKDQRVNAGLFQFIFLGTTIVMSLCVYIEYLNYKAGGLLPLNSKPIPGPEYISGWSDFPVEDEEFVARIVATREGDMSLSERPYTAVFKQKMDTFIEQKTAENAVMAWAQGFGLLISPMAPILIFLSGCQIYSAWRNKKLLIATLLCIALNGAAFYIAWIRVYLESLD